MIKFNFFIIILLPVGIVSCFFEKSENISIHNIDKKPHKIKNINEIVLIQYDSISQLKKVKTCWTSDPKNLFLSEYYDSNDKLIFIEKELPDSSIQLIHFSSELDSSGKLVAGEILFNEYFYSYFFQIGQNGLEEIRKIKNRTKSRKFLNDIQLKRYGRNILDSIYLDLVLFYAHNDF